MILNYSLLDNYWHQWVHNLIRVELRYKTKTASDTYSVNILGLRYRLYRGYRFFLYAPLANTEWLRYLIIRHIHVGHILNLLTPQKHVYGHSHPDYPLNISLVRVLNGL